MIDTRTVGKSIALLRRRQQLTQQGLAAAVNVSHQAVSKWENGVALPDMQTMLSLSRLFGVSIEELLNGSVLAEAEGEQPADDEAPETPLEEPSEPRIELKLDGGNPLNMNLVQQADDAVARALENCIDSDAADPAGAEASDAAEEAPEPEAPPASGDPQENPADDEAGAEADITFEEIVRMAPFVSRDALGALLEGCADQPEMAEIVSIAPFVGRDTLDQLLSRYRGKMDWDALRRLAPFMSRDGLAEAILADLDALNWEMLPKLAPFVSRDALAEILRRAPSRPDFAQLRRLAPFMSRDGLAQVLESRLDELDVDALISFAPFLNKAALGSLVERLGQPIDRKQMMRLARFLPREQVDRLVYRSMGKEPPKPKKDEWRVDVDLGSALNSLGNTISDAVQGAVREARDAIHSVRIDDVMDAVNDALRDVSDSLNSRGKPHQEPPKPDAARERSIRIRNRIAEKAFSDGNWDWIEAHIDEVSGDVLKKILMNCAEAGHAHLIAENLERVSLNSAEACRLAQSCEDEDVWERLLESGSMEEEHVKRVIDFIGAHRPDALDRFARFLGGKTLLNAALKALREGEDLSEYVEHMDAAGALELVKAALAEGYGDMETLLEHVDGAAVPMLLDAALDAGRTDLVSTLAEAADAGDIPAMAEQLARRGQWDALQELLDEADDADLNTVWPLALEQGRTDVLDSIAGHADMATLRSMALALADAGRFDALESFLDELDADALEQLLEKAMTASDWEAIDRIADALEDCRDPEA